MNTSPKSSRTARDFPSFVPPLLVKELRQGLRTRGFVAFLILFPLLMALPFLIYILAGTGVVEKEMISIFFWGCVILFFLVFNPLRTLSSVSQEKATRSGDLMAMTSLSSSGIVWEKWISYTLQTTLLALIVMPFLLLRYFLGGVEMVPELVAMAGIFVLTVVLTALGIWISGMPLLYKILYAIAVFLMLVVFPSLLLGKGWTAFRGIGEEPGLLCLSFAVFSVVLFSLCRGLLALAARWFASPSENTAFAFRRKIFWMTVITIIGNLVLWAADLDLAKIPTTLVILNSFYFFCLVSAFWVDMILPAELQSAHISKMKEAGFFWRLTKAAWLPGWQSSGLFFFGVLVVFCGVSMFFLSYGEMPEKGDMLVRSAFLIWADVALVIMALQVLWKKAGIHSLILFPLLMVSLLLFSALAKAAVGGDMDIDLLISVIPAANLLTIDSSDTGILTCNWVFISFVFLCFLVSSISYWKKYDMLSKRRHGKGTERESFPDDPAGNDTLQEIRDEDAAGREQF